ncbi:MAG: sigma-54-dependent Fis family transcriptional regulator, partial [bacterium]|nr:sigma-54-dependent Fis family transcriptional regulator [bacterium]
GYTKGAFTGAVGSRKGKMEQAHNGTLFLDEIENLSLDQQSKLLKVLEEKKINPLGSNAPKIVDFRLILATNINLQKLVEEGKFREDLFFRIHVYQVELPPLRERGEEDIYLIIDHYINDRSVTIEKDALELLKKYTWPGNARELKNLLKKFEIIARTNDNIITFEIVKEGFRKYKDRDQIKDTLGDLVDYYGGNVPAMLKDFEDAAVLGMFKEYTGNISKIAQKVYKESTEDTKNHREKVRKVLERNTHVLDEYDDIDD